VVFWYGITSALLGVLLFFPIRKVILALNVNRLQNKEKRPITDEELATLKRKITVIAAVICMTFAFLYNIFTTCFILCILQKYVQIIKPNLVFHLAGISSVKQCLLEPDWCEKVNVVGTQNLLTAIETLEQITSSNSTPKTIKKSITDLITDLNNPEYSLSVRAANTISLLDDVTQDPNMPSYVRTQLWQAVSKLESIRE